MDVREINGFVHTYLPSWVPRAVKEYLGYLASDIPASSTS